MIYDIAGGDPGSNQTPPPEGDSLHCYINGELLSVDNGLGNEPVRHNTHPSMFVVNLNPGFGRAYELLVEQGGELTFKLEHENGNTYETNASFDIPDGDDQLSFGEQFVSFFLALKINFCNGLFIKIIG